MRIRNLAVALLAVPVLALADEPQILARVDGVSITASQLASAVASSPFANGFATLEPEEQAKIRGNMLARLVDAELLRQEAKAIGLDKSPAFRREVDDFRSGTLYQRFVQSIRSGIEVPAELDATYKKRYRGNPDALAAARSAYVAKQFRQQKAQRFTDLANRCSLKTWPSRLAGGKDDTLLAEADGFRVHFRDIRAPDSDPQVTDDTPEMRQQRLDELVEMLLAARGAADEGIDVKQDVTDYVHALLPRMLIEKREREWIDDPSVLRSFFDRHPEIGRIAGFRNIGQIVLATREEAEQVRERILAGESLFRLAGELSIDPFGRAHGGDMGWQKEGNAHPAIEKALEQLDDNELSPVIETPAGFHLVTIAARKLGWQRTLSQVEDRVRQAIVQERLDAYLQELRNKHRVTWLMPGPLAPSNSSTAM